MRIDQLKMEKMRVFGLADRAFISGNREDQAKYEKQLQDLDAQIDELQSK